MYAAANISEFTQQDGKTFVCDKRDKAITYVFFRYLHLLLSQKDLFEGGSSLTESVVKQNYCHVCRVCDWTRKEKIYCSVLDCLLP